MESCCSKYIIEGVGTDLISINRKANLGINKEVVIDGYSGKKLVQWGIRKKIGSSKKLMKDGHHNTFILTQRVDSQLSQTCTPTKSSREDKMTI